MNTNEIRDKWEAIKAIDAMLNSGRYRVDDGIDDLVKGYYRTARELERELERAIGDRVIRIGANRVVFVDSDDYVCERELVSEDE